MKKKKQQKKRGIKQQAFVKWIQMYIVFRLPGHLYIYVCINYLFPNELICDLQKVGTKFNLIDLNLIFSTCYGNYM